MWALAPQKSPSCLSVSRAEIALSSTHPRVSVSRTLILGDRPEEAIRCSVLVHSGTEGVPPATPFVLLTVLESNPRAVCASTMPRDEHPALLDTGGETIVVLLCPEYARGIVVDEEACVERLIVAGTDQGSLLLWSLRIRIPSRHSNGAESRIVSVASDRGRPDLVIPRVFDSPLARIDPQPVKRIKKSTQLCVSFCCMGCDGTIAGIRVVPPQQQISDAELSWRYKRLFCFSGHEGGRVVQATWYESVHRVIVHVENGAPSYVWNIKTGQLEGRMELNGALASAEDVTLYASAKLAENARVNVRVEGTPSRLSMITSILALLQQRMLYL